MSHSISGIVGDFDLLKCYAASHELHPPTRLINHLGFLPLSRDHLDILYPVQGDFDPSMNYLSSALKKTLSELSSQAPVAFIETEYFGGTGTQAATAYDQGRCVMSPISEETGPISRALSILGVIIVPGHPDEFATAGLNRHRNNDKWINETEPQ